ncbi:MAG: diguanylate cyclase [Acetivibrionales bacterium]
MLKLAESVFSLGKPAIPGGEQWLTDNFVMVTHVIMIVLQFFKGFLFEKGLYENRYVYYIEKIQFLIMLILIINFSDIGPWFYVGILLPIMTTSLVKGPRPGFLLLAGSMAVHLSVILFTRMPAAIRGEIPVTEFRAGIVTVAVQYLMYFIVTTFYGRMYSFGIEYEIQNKSIIEQFEERCLKLEAAKDEMMKQYEKIVSNSGMLEESNKRLSKSIAEFYTLHQITQAIGSVLDVKELLKRLNDIILGVMGVSYSTIALYDSGIGRLKVHTTNISNISELATMTDNINSSVLTDALDKGSNILENNVDSTKYAFTQGRDIKSLICVPLITGKRKYGLVLVEHKYEKVFDSDSVRFLSIIAQQVGIVMENAELYYKMKELARRDGLTDVYNRQYFQELLEIEFKNAERENYPLSLAIFDIDYFKRFNDLYGHMFGDKVLVSIINTVKPMLRKNDIIARYGGEEFVILFPRTNLKEAYEKAETLRKIISDHVVQESNISVSVTASFGISSFSECALTEQELIRTADDALYKAKSVGRNCVIMAKRLDEGPVS